MSENGEALILTLGYGKRSIDEALALLQLYGVKYLIDVRSAPYSRYHPDFSRDALKQHVASVRIAYLFMGEELGGRPDDPTCYDQQGRVDYDACRKRKAFQHGMGRLDTAWSQGQRIALLCSESRPEQCHRSKLIGAALAETGIQVMHLDENGALLSQEEVMGRLLAGQINLFEDLPPASTTRSRGQYRRNAP